MRRPRFIAEQSRNARGFLGRIVAHVMARETWTENLRAIDALGLDPDDRVIDVGCGHGRALELLASRVHNGHVTGVDSSELMAEIALERNRRLVRKGLVDVTVAPVEELPYATGAFNKALCVHVVYFWRDLHAAFSEVGRVVGPGGRLSLIYWTANDQHVVDAFPKEIYRFPAVEAVCAALGAAGFDVEPPQPSVRANERQPTLMTAKKRSN